MNSYTYKRKVDLIWETAPSVYERPGLGILSTPTTSGQSVEVLTEPPKKRYRQNAAQTGLQTAGLTCTVSRVAKPLLSNEQIQQFIASTVLPHGRTLAKVDHVGTHVTNDTTPAYPSQILEEAAQRSISAGQTKWKGHERVSKKPDGVPADRKRAEETPVASHNTANSKNYTDGKTNAKRIVIPAKIRTEPIQYPPYVTRIMKILQRQQEADKTGQTTSSDNNPRDNFGCTPKPAPENKDKPSTDKNKLDPSTNTNKRGTVEPFTNLSTEKSAVNKKHETTNECSHKDSGNKSFKKTIQDNYKPVSDIAMLTEDLSPDRFTMLDASNFDGPEILVTSGPFCFMAPVPFF